MVGLTLFQSLTNSHRVDITVEDTDYARADMARRNGMPARVTDQITGAQYEIAWIDVGSSYRGHVILRQIRPAVSA